MILSLTRLFEFSIYTFPNQTVCCSEIGSWVWVEQGHSPCPGFNSNIESFYHLLMFSWDSISDSFFSSRRCCSPGIKEAPPDDVSDKEFSSRYIEFVIMILILKCFLTGSSWGSCTLPSKLCCRFWILSRIFEEAPLECSLNISWSWHWYGTGLHSDSDLCTWFLFLVPDQFRDGIEESRKIWSQNHRYA